MARIRKPGDSKGMIDQPIWKVGKYIRLSREDGNIVSESVVNQERILNDEIPAFFEAGCYEVVDAYIDDGASGTTDLERMDFQRMIGDVKTGRINCIIVKNLSRAFRNSADQGNFLEEFIPLYNTRFISLYQPRIDTFLNPEIVHSLEVSITGFLNEQYAYKTSADVRRTFRHKRENGEFIGAFAPYGYMKDPKNKNALLIDEEAAQIVRAVFRWFVMEGMSKSGIVKRLNASGIPNPSTYKHSKGLRFHIPCSDRNDGLWNAMSITRMLQDPIYIGTLRQGRQRVISYKIHKRAAVPESEWSMVEGAVPAIIDKATFDLAQTLRCRDTRAAPGKREVYLFSGLLRCADCQKSMKRHAARGYIYYQCRTNREKSRTQCTKHSIRLDRLEQAVLTAIQQQIRHASSLMDVIAEIENTPAPPQNTPPQNMQLAQQARELDKLTGILDGLHWDWKNGDITHEQYLRLRERYTERVQRLQDTVSRLQKESENRPPEPVHDSDSACLSTFLMKQNIDHLTRGLLVELIDTVYVHEDKSIQIEFTFSDPRANAKEGKSGGQSTLAASSPSVHTVVYK